MGRPQGSQATWHTGGTGTPSLGCKGSRPATSLLQPGSCQESAVSLLDKHLFSCDHIFLADIEAECRDDFMKLRVAFNDSFTGLIYSAGIRGFLLQTLPEVTPKPQSTCLWARNKNRAGEAPFRYLAFGSRVFVPTGFPPFLFQPFSTELSPGSTKSSSAPLSG